MGVRATAWQTSAHSHTNAAAYEYTHAHTYAYCDSHIDCHSYANTDIDSNQLRPFQLTTPTATRSPTMTPIPTDTPVPTATATHIAAPTNTPEPTKTPVPPTQMPAVVFVVVTATPSADAPSGGGCNSVSTVPVGAATANLLLLVAPLGIIGGVRYRRRKKGTDRYE